MSWMSKWSPQLLSILRIIIAFLFMEHGTMKLFSFPMAMNPAHAPGGHVPLFSLIGLAGVLEVFGGLLILLGLCTRPVAFLLSGEMAVAYFMAHAPHGFWPIMNHGEAAVFYCFVFLYLSAAGAGPWSVDNLISRSKPEVSTD